MTKDDWLILIAVLVLLWYVSRKKTGASVTINGVPNPQVGDQIPINGYRDSGGDALSRIIDQQGDSIRQT